MAGSPATISVGSQFHRGEQPSYGGAGAGSGVRLAAPPHWSSFVVTVAQEASKLFFPLDRLTSEDSVRVWLKTIEREQGVAPDGNGAFCPTGEPYQTIAWTPKGECVKQGAERAATFDTPKLAWMLWVSAFNVYKVGRLGKVCWRHRPELCKTDDGRYLVFARLYIPRKPLW